MFDAHAADKWELVSEKSKCFLCEKQKQVLIYFDANDKSNLKEVKDKKLKDFMKIKLKVGPASKGIKEQNCLIFGSVTHGWHRKVQMLTADIFALFSLAQKENLMKNMRKGR